MIAAPPEIVGEIPFRKAFDQAIRAGVKTCTSRGQKYAKTREALRVRYPKGERGGFIILTDLHDHTLGYVADNLWREEGCQNAEHFKSIWKALHRGHWDREQVVWVHHFDYWCGTHAPDGRCTTDPGTCLP